MTTKQIVGVIALILMLPMLFSLLVFSLHIGTGDAQQNVERASNLMVDAATPWWLGAVEKLAGWGTFGAIVIIAFFLVLKKYPELQ